MATTYDRLIAAGAPDLPEPLFYRIKFTEEGSIAVEIREQRQRFGSALLVRRVVPIHRSTPERVLHAVVEAAVHGYANVQAAAKVADLIGDHS